MNTVELNSIDLQSIDIASNNVSSIGKFIKRNKGIKLLPKEYQQVEYIEGTGTQWIDTNITLKQNSSFDVRFYCTNNPPEVGTGRAHVIGFHDGNNRNRLRILQPCVLYFLYGNNGLSWPFYDTVIKNKITDFHYSINNFVSIIDGITYTKIPESTYTFVQSNSTIKLFNNPSTTGEQIFEGRFYFFKLKEDNTFVRNMIPCYRKSDGEVGMYDVINDVFYTNQGTGTFLKGPNVNDKEYKIPYIKGHITTSDSTFTFSVDGNNKTVPIDANGDFELKVKKPITSLSFVGVPQLESLELFAINGVTTFDVDYPTTVSYIRCDSTIKNAKNDVYHIRGTATDDFTFTLKYIDDNNTVTTITESAVIDGDGKWDVAYSGKKVYGLSGAFYSNNNLKTIEFTEPLQQLLEANNSDFNYYGIFHQAGNLSKYNLEVVTFAVGTKFDKINRFYNTFRCCKSVSVLDLRDATFENVVDIGGAFGDMTNMHTLRLDGANFKNLYISGTNITFTNDTSLVNLYVPQNSTMPISFSLQDSPLSYDSMLRVAGWLKDLTGGTAQTVTFKADTYNALTAEQKAELEGIIVTQKGWVLATA